MNRYHTVLALALTLTACYGAARPVPKTAELPPLVDGGTVDVDVETVRYWSDYRLRYVHGKVINGMSYNNVPLNYHQLRTLADPSYPGKIADYGKLVQRCKRANVPRYIGFTGVVAGAAAWVYGGALFQERGDLQTAVGVSLISAGLLSYAAGYTFLGGQACRDAEKEATALHLSAADEVKILDDDLIVEIAHIANTFNRRMRASSP